MSSLQDKTVGDREESARTALSPRKVGWILGSILLLALLLRLAGVFHDLPFSYYGDELHLMKRAMALGTGDLNPHWFHKPAFLMYVLLFAYGLYFLGGSAIGRFESVDHFAAHFLTEHGSFLLIGRLIVMLCGVALVYVIYLLGRRLSTGPHVALSGALLVAVTPALVSSSQEIKADIPCALLIAMSLLFYVRDLERGEGVSRSLVLASLLAGAAMGTKYYGIILVPAYGLWEIRRSLRGRVDWRTVLRRLLVLVVLFIVGFFLVSPYNFLDPTWGNRLVKKVSVSLGFAGTPTIFEIDSTTEYVPGPTAWLGAGADFIKRLVDQRGMGLPLAAVFALGLLASLSSRKIHGYWLLVALPIALFLAFSVLFAPYHAQSRHLTAILPLFCLLSWPAVRAVSGIIVRSERRRLALAVATVLLLALTSASRSIAANRAIMKKDSRTVAYGWVIDNLSPEDRLLLEDDGPSLRPNRLAIARLEERLDSLSKGPFVLHARRQLEILERFEPPDGRNLDLLSRPWWLSREKTDAEMARSSIDTDMSNPLISRVPKPLEEYRADGIRYVLTTSIVSRWLGRFDDPEMRFPSFVRFHDALARLGPIATIDPEDWNGKGPVIWIHDLALLDSELPDTDTPATETELPVGGEA